MLGYNIYGFDYKIYRLYFCNQIYTIYLLLCILNIILNMLEIRDLYDFSISNWYSKFKELVLPTIIIELPTLIVEKFQADEEIDLDETCYQEFKDNVKNALNTFDNKAFVKNNWHAPTDAKVFSFGNTLQVCNVNDLMLYFETSHIIQEDFSNAKGVNFCVALRKWVNIHPASEFRCIVINNILRGITPRDWPTFYAHFADDGHRIIEKLKVFFVENIKCRFPRTNYIFDVVYCFPDEPYIIDFGSLNCKTNLYAFTWNEIHPLINENICEEVAPVFRYLESDYGIMTRTDALNRFVQSQI